MKIVTREVKELTEIQLELGQCFYNGDGEVYMREAFGDDLLNIGLTYGTVSIPNNYHLVETCNHSINVISIGSKSSNGYINYKSLKCGEVFKKDGISPLYLRIMNNRFINMYVALDLRHGEIIRLETENFKVRPVNAELVVFS